MLNLYNLSAIITPWNYGSYLVVTFIINSKKSHVGVDEN